MDLDGARFHGSTTRKDSADSFFFLFQSNRQGVQIRFKLLHLGECSLTDDFWFTFTSPDLGDGSLMMMLELLLPFPPWGHATSSLLCDLVPA